MDWSKSLRDTAPRSKILVGNGKSLSTALSEHRSVGPLAFSDSDSVSSTPRRTPPYRQPSRNSRENSETPPSRAKNAKRTPSFTPPARIREESPSRSPPGSPRIGSLDGDDMSETTEADSDFEGDCVQVLVRVRPANETEMLDATHQPCLSIMGTRNIILHARGKEPYQFKFDQVLPDTTEQDEVFDIAGMPIVDNCINGYNSSIFAYGQTGSGKTYTMLGAIKDAADSRRGLVPRVFEFLFQRVAEQEDQKGRDCVQYSCRCSFLEIYNETITDLLNPTATNLQIREGDKRGPFVEALTEEIVLNVDEVLALLRRGAENRHVGATLMNRESSRSHSVFTCTVERKTKSSSGLTNVLFSRLNLIDLAGSERQKQSGVQGGHLKEACHINKSLTILGRVIMELVDAQRSGRPRHVPYRDSRLTFLLQDSLGGNAKTMIIANVSPSAINSGETLSTLQFAKRAKFIRNRPEQNQETTGQVSALQREITRLNSELQDIRKGNNDMMVAENENLRKQLQTEEDERQEMQLRMDQLTADNNRYKRERDRLDVKLTRFQSDRRALCITIEGLEDDLERCRTSMAGQSSHQDAINQVLEEQLQLVCSQLATESASRAAAEAEVKERDVRYAKLQKELAASHQVKQQLEDALEQSRKGTDELEEDLQRERSQATQAMESAKHLQAKLQQQRQECSALHSKYTALQQQDLANQDQLDSERSRNQVLTANMQMLETQLSTTRTKLQQEEIHSADLQQQLVAARAAAAEAAVEAAKQHQAVTELLHSCEEKLQQSQCDVAEVQDKLQAAESLGTAAEAQVQRLQAQVAELSARTEELTAQHASVEQQLHDALAVHAEETARFAEASHEEACRLHTEAAARQEKELQLEKLEAEVERLLGELAAGKDANEGLEADIGSLQQQLEQQAADSAQRQEELTSSLTVKGDELKAASKKLQDVEGQLAATKQEVAKLQAAYGNELAGTEVLRQEASELQERLDAVVSERDTLNSSLEAEQQALEKAQAELASLKQAHAELGTREAEVSALGQQLKDDLAAAQHQLASAKEQVTALGSQLEAANSELASRKAELESTAGSLGVARSEIDVLTSQLKHRSEQLESTSSELTETCSALATVKEQLDSCQKDLEAAREQLAGKEQHSDGLSSELDAMKARLEVVKVELGAAEKREEQLQGQACELERSLREAKEECGRRRQQEEDLTAQIATMKDALDNALAEVDQASRAREKLETDLRSKAQRYTEEVQHLTGKLEQVTEESEKRLKGAHDDQQRLESDLRNQLEDLREELVATKASLHTSSSDCQMLKDNLAAAEALVQDKQSRLTDAAEQIAMLQQCFEEEQAACREAREVASVAEKEVAELKRKAELEATRTGTQHQEQQQRVHDLQKELIKAQEKLVRAELDTKQQVQQLTIKLEEAEAKLQSTCSELDQVQALHTQDKAGVEHLEGEIAELQKAMGDAAAAAEQEQKRLTQKLVLANQDIAHYKERLSETEGQIKDELVRNARHGRAFQEIRRLIDWAVTPGTPVVRSSLAGQSPKLPMRAQSAERFRGSGDLYEARTARTPRGSIQELQLVSPRASLDDVRDIPLMQLPARMSAAADRRSHALDQTSKMSMVLPPHSPAN